MYDKKDIIGVKLKISIFQTVERAKKYILSQGFKPYFRKKEPLNVGEYWIFKQKDYGKYLTRPEKESKNGVILFVYGYDKVQK